MAQCIKCIHCRARIPLQPKIEDPALKIIGLLEPKEQERIKFLLSKINYKKAIITCEKGMWFDGRGEKQRKFKGLDRLSVSKYIKEFEGCLEFASSY